MAKLVDLFKKYEEKILLNRVQCRIISCPDKLLEFQKYPLYIDFVKREGDYMFMISNNILRLSADNSLNFQDEDSDDVIKRNYIFALEEKPWKDKSELEKTHLKYMRCGLIEKRLDLEKEIAFDENFFMEYSRNHKESDYKGYKNLERQFEKDFVFSTEEADYLFLETFLNSDRNLRIRGLNTYADVTIIDDDKWILRRVVEKPFPRNYNDFLSFSVYKFNSVQFKYESEAIATHEKIRKEDIKGTTIFALWKKYAEIEEKKAKALKEKLGSLRFCSANQRKNGITTIKLEPNKEQEEALSEIDIEEISFNICDKEPYDNDDFKNSEIITISKYDNETKQAIIKNNDYPIKQNSSGFLIVNIKGDLIVQKRRDSAQREFEKEAPSLVLMYLRQAMEGKINNAQYYKSRKILTLTQDTRTFIKKHLGLEKLTEDQEKAVEIALNTPDIAVIQGPPGTGKSTVVAVICQRLIEIAKKERNTSNKVILLSAFQNDTVEHTAAKIKTYGLPTIKIGKDVQGIRAEDGFIQRMQKAIDLSLQKLAPNVKIRRLSKIFADLKFLLEKENNVEYVRKEINELIQSTTLSEELVLEWKSIFHEVDLADNSQEKAINALKGLRTEIEAYKDDGYKSIRRLLSTRIQFDEEEKAFLENAPFEDEEISADFLKKLRDIKEKYLSLIYGQNNEIKGGDFNALLEWLEKAVQYFKKEEALALNDLDTFLTANLENLRDDLDGNSDYIRETIRRYGDSIASTNQYAGSRAVNEFEYENVVLEEAARSNPLDLLIPMARATDRIILVGDQKQLPHLLEPDILNEAVEGDTEKRKKYEESLFGILFRNLEEAIPTRRITLTKQFRMHPVIGDFISENFYDKMISSEMVDPAKKRHGLNIPWAKDKVAVFCAVNEGTESRGSRSKERLSEAKRVIALLNELKADPAFDNLNIGIISFYSKQVERIKEEASKFGYTVRSEGGFKIAPAFQITSDGREKLRIGSVDSFQGKEFDVVILSTVRSNNITRTDDNYLKVFGFLTLENRLNVAFSRAQKMLITVGDAKMFNDDFAAKYVPSLYNFYTKLAGGNYGGRI